MRLRVMLYLVPLALAGCGYTNNAGEAAASLELTARDIRFMGGGGGPGGSGGEDRGSQQGYDDFAPPPENVNDIPF